jgi:hypothetical protein
VVPLHGKPRCSGGSSPTAPAAAAASNQSSAGFHGSRCPRVCRQIGELGRRLSCYTFRLKSHSGPLAILRSAIGLQWLFHLMTWSEDMHSGSVIGTIDVARGAHAIHPIFDMAHMQRQLCDGRMQQLPPRPTCLECEGSWSMHPCVILVSPLLVHLSLVSYSLRTKPTVHHTHTSYCLLSIATSRTRHILQHVSTTCTCTALYCSRIQGNHATERVETAQNCIDPDG